MDHWQQDFPAEAHPGGGLLQNRGLLNHDRRQRRSAWKWSRTAQWKGRDRIYDIHPRYDVPEDGKTGLVLDIVRPAVDCLVVDEIDEKLGPGGIGIIAMHHGHGSARIARRGRGFQWSEIMNGARL